jgi:hypothetical protein
MRTTEQKIIEACKILGVKRVAMKPAARQFSAALAAAVSHDQEFWFGPKGEPIGIYTPAEGLAALRRCVAFVKVAS